MSTGQLTARPVPPRSHTQSPTQSRPPAGPSAVIERLNAVLVGWLSRHSIDVLRISLGAVFLAFGALKFFPGVSPAENLAVRTLDTLTFGIVSGDAALLLTAVAESFVGLTLITGRLLRIGLLALAASLVGIMSPLVLFAGDMFPGGTPTLEAQYVFKGVVLAAAGMVIAARALGAKLVRP